MHPAPVQDDEFLTMINSAADLRADCIDATPNDSLASPVA